MLNFLEGEDDGAKTLDAVKKNITIKEANLWILVCVNIAASVGLNVNSTALLQLYYSAMLISLDSH
ncbi:hypothetical protein [Flavobacterium hungaricum]|uniref:hypothetical protein n=1 Tax=Flavobacterium hungaricum TaxID=2082725 RepID=UPI001883A26A|nr:hypothetical protein [Flavobacterium hungaricum]